MRGQREKVQNGQRGIRDLKTRVGQECSISRGGRLYSGGIQTRGVQRGSHSVTSRGTAGGRSKSESCQEL